MTHIWKVNKTKSHIDISICSPELLTLLNWDVYEEPLDSDHLPIIIESKTQQHYVTGIARWILDKGNWDLFVRLVSSDHPNYDKFSKARAEAKRTIKASKRNAWQKFIESIEFKASTKELWQKINMLNCKHKSDQVN